MQIFVYNRSGRHDLKGRFSLRHVACSGVCEEFFAGPTSGDGRISPFPEGDELVLAEMLGS